MNEMIKSFIDKEVIIYFSGGSCAEGFIKEIEDSWVKIEKRNGQFEIISLDYVSRIQEYPRNSKGKGNPIKEFFFPS